MATFLYKDIRLHVYMLFLLFSILCKTCNQIKNVMYESYRRKAWSVV